LAKLKAHVDSITFDTGDPIELFKKAFCEDDATSIRKLLERHPDLRRRSTIPSPRSTRR